MANRLDRVRELGQSIWVDHIRRGSLASGELDGWIAAGVTGVTSNPSIFQKALAGGHDYDGDVRKLARQGRATAAIAEALIVDDIRATADRLRAVWEGTGGDDGYVSVEVSPPAARSTDTLLAEARRLWTAVDRPNVMIKVPATGAGLPAIRELTRHGIPVNVTLIFGLDRYRQVADAWLSGMEARAPGGAGGWPRSVASFFLSRVDQAIDPGLDRLVRGGGPEAEQAAELRGQAAVSLAKVAYREYELLFGSDRFTALAFLGARPQRLLWASTSTKDPSYPDLKYVDELVGPDTVTTLPPETLQALADHGDPAPRLTEGVDAAHRALDRLQDLGIGLSAVASHLEVDGERKFAESWDQLIEAVERKRAETGGRRPEPVRLSLGRWEDGFRARMTSLGEGRIGERVWARDRNLWPGAEPRASMGWLRSAEAMEEQVEDLRAFVEEVRGEGIRQVLVAGMGGSVLAAGLFGRLAEGIPDGLPVAVLDSTDPVAVLAAEAAHPPASTLFVVSGKSGATLETMTFLDRLHLRARDVLGSAAGGRFAAITDPGTRLDERARELRFRRIFHGFPDVGWGYSALSPFGLVPAALAGLDVSAVLGRAEWMAQGCAAHVPASANPGVRLGVALGELALRGRDKVTIVAPPALAPLADWIELLLAGATGKGHRGIIPVVGEALREPGAYGNDRVFVALEMGTAPDFRTSGNAGGNGSGAISDLRAFGHPVLEFRLDDPADVGRELFRWHFAAVVAAHVLGVNPFEEPDTAALKAATDRVLRDWSGRRAFPDERPSAREEGLTVFGGDGPGVAGQLATFLNGARPGDWVAIQAFLPPDREMATALSGLRDRLSETWSVAATAGFGPRFLHATGQLHKAGPATGRFLQLTWEPDTDVPVPDRPWSFGVLEQAQALVDRQALRAAGRTVLRLHLGSDRPRALRAVLRALELAGGPSLRGR